jgi:SAM-dependent methyltransferase
VLDIGCGLQPYRRFLDPAVTEYVGIDREGPLSRPTVVGSAESLPFPDQSFDVVLSTQVLEHLPDPERALREAVRVLKRGGRMILTVPGVWPTHEAPHDFWRFTRHGLMRLLADHEIVYRDLEALGGLWATLGQMTSLEIHRIFGLRELIPMMNVCAELLDKLPSHEDLVMNWFVDGVRAR